MRKIFAVRMGAYLLALFMCGCSNQISQLPAQTAQPTSPTAPTTPATPPQSPMHNLAAAMENYSFTTRPVIPIGCLGSSLGVGASTPDPATQSPCAHFVSDLQAQFPGYNFQAVNDSVNGSTSWQWGAAWTELTTHALSGVTINTPGSGYNVGDWEVVNQSATAQTGYIIVTAVSTGGVPTAIAISPYPGCITEGDVSAPSSALYAVGTNIATLNSAPVNGAQVGTGAGLTVNITGVGYKPVVTLLVYGMNDGDGPLNYNSGETLSGGVAALTSAIQAVQAAGADPVVFTSTHESVVWDGGGAGYSWASGAPCYLAQFMLSCSAAISGIPSVVDPIASVTTGDLAGMGTTITVNSRMIEVNSNYRTVATANNAALIDTEKYWFEALETETASLGSQLAAEQAMFPSPGPHPNLLGEQLGYWKSIDDFVAGLTAQVP